MKINKTQYIIALLFTAIILSCSSNSSKTETQETISETEASTNEEKIEITGFNTIEELSKSVIESLQKRDYDSYYSHIMTEEMELSQANRIEDEKVRKEFIHEYGFSLHEEKEYFENLLHYYDTRNIDLSKATLADMEYTEYKEGKYEPIMLYEVFIPIEMEIESLIDFTTIEVDGKFYLTSEIGI
ncbi:MAG: hypothetical protein OEW67_04340 [Cyclobacteriaceae bacterium]|nr:hypothetical protein [Cyclobacteriaceae bacterium]